MMNPKFSIGTLVATAALSLSALSGSATGQATMRPGFFSDIDLLPPSAQAVCDLPGPAVVYFDGSALVLDDGLSNVTPLLQWANPPSFASFTVPAGPNAVVFGESSNGTVWHVPLDGVSQPRLVATLAFNYDAVMLDADTLLVSAKTGGFAVPDNDLVAVDLRTTNTDLIAALPGFSGPLARDAAGTVYYGIGRGATADILAFDAATIASAFGPTVLDETAATTVITGLPSATTIAVDADDDLFVGDYSIPALIEVDRHPGAPAQWSVFIDYVLGGPSAVGVRFADAPDHAAFEPYQPAYGKVLTVVESTGSSGTRIRTLTPRRPAPQLSTGSPIPTGAFSVQADLGDPGAVATCILGLSPASLPPIAIPGFEQPIFFDVALASVFATIPAPVDASGRASLGFVNPGFAAPVTFELQFLFVDSTTRVIGSSSSMPLVLAQ